MKARDVLTADELAAIDTAAIALRKLAQQPGGWSVVLEVLTDGRVQIRGEDGTSLRWRVLADLHKASTHSLPSAALANVELGQ